MCVPFSDESEGFPLVRAVVLRRAGEVAHCR
jgi:hypothetical protein